MSRSSKGNFFCISYRPGQPTILLMCLSVPCLIWVSTITGSVLVLWYNICTISIFRCSCLLNHHILCLVVIFLLWEFFTTTLTDVFSLKSEWQQISSTHQDSFQYSVWLQQYCSLDGLLSSFYFQVLHSLYHSVFWMYRVHYLQLVSPSLSSSIGQFTYLSFRFFIGFSLWSAATAS